MINVYVCNDGRRYTCDTYPYTGKECQSQFCVLPCLLFFAVNVFSLCMGASMRQLSCPAEKYFKPKMLLHRISLRYILWKVY